MILRMLWDAAVQSRVGSLARHRSQDETCGGSGIRKKFRVTGGVVHNASTCELSNSASAFVLCICSCSTRTRIAGHICPAAILSLPSRPLVQSSLPQAVLFKKNK